MLAQTCDSTKTKCDQYPNVDFFLLFRNSFQGNQVTDQGGALYVTGQEITIRRNTFEDNNSEGNAGAVIIRSTYPVVSSNTFLANKAYIAGAMRLVTLRP